MAADTAATPLTGDAPASAEERLTTLFTVFVSIGYLLYFLLLSPVIVDQAEITARWWTPAAVALVFGPPIVMGIAGYRKRLTVARRAAAVSAIGFVIAACVWPLAWNGGFSTSDAWISLIPGMAAMSAAAVWRPRWVMVVLLAAVLPAQLILYSVRDPQLRVYPIPDIVFSFSYCLIYVLAALMAIRTGRLLDATRADAYAAAAAAAATAARAVQRTRYNALLHDWVMSTLLAAARQSHTDEVRRQAQVTLAKLDALHSEQTATYTPDQLLAYLRTAVAAVDDGLLVSTHIDARADLVIPGDAVHAAGEAVAEAVRNSVLHAGATARRTVDATVTGTGFRVTVHDTGDGFDPAAVASNRMGVAVSILGRMRGLAGGSAQLASRPGAGTTVTIGWRAPA